MEVFIVGYPAGNGARMYSNWNKRYLFETTYEILETN